MVKHNVHIEGESDIRLKEGFKYFLTQGNHNLPVFPLMCKTKDSAIKSYKDSLAQYKYLLIDLDTTKDNRSLELRKHDLENDENVYFMIQECEAWFLSQPEILNEYYNSFDFVSEYKNMDVKTIKGPSSKIDNKLKHESNTKKYHKIDHCSDLLKKLDVQKLKKDFSDVENLLNKLSN